MECLAAAPSKLQRPVGDRVKTDARDAMHLARLLRLGEIVAVTVSDPAVEAAWDLVRAREDARVDLTPARHRVSKLLLRHGIVYPRGRAWTGTLTCPGSTRSAPGAPRGPGRVRDGPGRGAVHAQSPGPPGCPHRGDRRARAVGAGGDPADVPARGLDADRVRAGGGDRGLAPVHRPFPGRLCRSGAC